VGADGCKPLIASGPLHYRRRRNRHGGALQGSCRSRGQADWRRRRRLRPRSRHLGGRWQLPGSSSSPRGRCLGGRRQHPCSSLHSRFSHLVDLPVELALLHQRKREAIIFKATCLAARQPGRLPSPPRMSSGTQAKMLTGQVSLEIAHKSTLELREARTHHDGENDGPSKRHRGHCTHNRQAASQ
jgi:hypothetical protein